MKRICVYGKDVANITGRSVRHGYDILKRIRKLHGKKKHQMVTLDELYDYLGIDKDSVPPLV